MDLGSAEHHPIDEAPQFNGLLPSFSNPVPENQVNSRVGLTCFTQLLLFRASDGFFLSFWRVVLMRDRCFSATTSSKRRERRRKRTGIERFTRTKIHRLELKLKDAETFLWRQTSWVVRWQDVRHRWRGSSIKCNESFHPTKPETMS